MADRNPSHPDHPPARAARQTFDGTKATQDDIVDETGESAGVGIKPGQRTGDDIGFDRVVDADGAGLGGGLDQAEEAQLGVTDEQLAEMARRDGKSQS